MTFPEATEEDDGGYLPLCLMHEGSARPHQPPGTLRYTPRKFRREDVRLIFSYGSLPTFRFDDFRPGFRPSFQINFDYYFAPLT